MDETKEQCGNNIQFRRGEIIKIVFSVRCKCRKTKCFPLAIEMRRRFYFSPLVFVFFFFLFTPCEMCSQCVFQRDTHMQHCRQHNTFNERRLKKSENKENCNPMRFNFEQIFFEQEIVCALNIPPQRFIEISCSRHIYATINDTVVLKSKLFEVCIYCIKTHLSCD